MAANLFDANYYQLVNPDLAAAGLTTKEQLFSHFLNAGINEGRAFSPLIDLKFYQENNPDLGVAGLTTNKQIYEHLQNLGIAEGRRFSPLVDLNFYLAVNPDVNQAFLGDRTQAFQHLQTSGIAENRRFSPLVNLNFYLAANQDVAQALGSDRYQVFTHLQTRGIAEQRKYSPVFDHRYYRQINPDLAAANLSAQQLLTHFQTYGINEGRRASPNLDLRYYLETNTDLKAAEFNYQQAFQHASTFGWREGRLSAPGHALNEPVLVWQQKLPPYPSVGIGGTEVINGIRSSSSGNAHVIRTLYRREFSVATLINTYNGLTGASPSNQFLNGNYGVSAFDASDNLYITQGEPQHFAFRRIGSHILTSKYDSSGNLLWQQKFLATNLPSHTPGTDVNYIPSSVLTADNAGNVYIAADTTENLGGTYAGGTDTVIIKYDTNGNQQWIKQLGTSEFEFPRKITVDNAGNLYIVGTTKGSFSIRDIVNINTWVAKYDSLTGEQVWVKQIGDATKEYVRSISTNNNGNLVVVGTTSESQFFNYFHSIWLAEYDALTGTERSLSQIPVSNYDSSFSFMLDRSGNLYTLDDLSGTNLVLSKYNLSGTKEWSMTKSDVFSIGYVDPDNNGNIYAIGDFNNNGNWELGVGKFSPISDFF